MQRQTDMKPIGAFIDYANALNIDSVIWTLSTTLKKWQVRERVYKTGYIHLSIAPYTEQFRSDSHSYASTVNTK